ncbi:hypothetical protein BCR34DRAFT_583546 [Clohesyomyces aquaticus]|uniref:Uncharacterized protein n=1 Tax=Clohesyomyces aquaticus TaxID=1231657 RepID=A0A1Y2A5V2_9PLEO|nr:hypothetical protein BCR34DRAFT_583546 [Clohesyomyces aquaticus]
MYCRNYVCLASGGKAVKGEHVERANVAFTFTHGAATEKKRMSKRTHGSQVWLSNLPLPSILNASQIAQAASGTPDSPFRSLPLLIRTATRTSGRESVTLYTSTRNQFRKFPASSPLHNPLSANSRASAASAARVVSSRLPCLSSVAGPDAQTPATARGFYRGPGSHFPGWTSAGKTGPPSLSLRFSPPTRASPKLTNGPAPRETAERQPNFTHHPMAGRISTPLDYCGKLDP